jgi:phospho-N-acetylmuramoyl-pentapeptide-transferase
MSDLITILFFSFLLTVFSSKRVISLLKKSQGKGQPIRNDGPESHLSKAGTPTMGGLIIISCVLICAIIACRLNDIIVPILFVMISYGLIGFSDDYSKVKKQTTKGIKAKLRLVLEFVIAWVALGYIQIKVTPSTVVNVPFLKEGIEFGYAYYILASLAIVGTANATNLTDGLDGLLTGPVIMLFATFAVMIYMISQKIYPEGRFGPLLNFNEIDELLKLCIIFIGVCLGFLWYNANPAKVFMGDVGSLALGGAIGTISILLRQEIYLIVMGGLFVVEALSVMLQVASYKMRKKRIFRMAPIHHHFEKAGMAENTVVMRFWIVNLMLCILGLHLTFM